MWMYTIYVANTGSENLTVTKITQQHVGDDGFLPPVETYTPSRMGWGTDSSRRVWM